MKFKAIIFDLDGTLLDTLDDLADSMNTVLKGFGFPRHEISAYKYFIGNGIEKLVERALPDSQRDENMLKRATEEMKAVYSRNWAEKTHPYEGILALLDSCVDRGLQMNILSNKPDGPTQKAVSHFFAQWHFEVVWGARPSVPKKPDPSAALEISARLGVSPQDFLYLGDSQVDMLTAVSANMYAVGALWGFREAEELIAAGAQILVDRPSDLLAWF
jgi:phosphoglycolate phosphatase